MQVLFVTEGTYPYVMGGVSTWCNQIVQGLPEHQFTVAAITGPLPATAVYPRPKNVKKLLTLPIWRPRELPAATKADMAIFDENIEDFLAFLNKDQNRFADGLLELARLGDRVNIWPLFERRKIWHLVHKSLAKKLKTKPPLAEVAIAVNWLKSALSPLLFIPPKADLAHTVSNGMASLVAFVAARAHGIPLVLTEHGVYLRERYLAFSDENDPYSVKFFRARFYNTLARLVYARADLVLSVSEFNRKWQLELGAAEKRTKVIPNGVDQSRFEDFSEKSEDVPTISWIGRIDPLKDVETLISAFSIVKKEIPNAKLDLYGPIPEGNESYHQGLVKLIDELGLDSVSFKGRVNGSNIVFENSDLMAISSVSEGSPYVVIEAMMSAKAVVATRVGGVGELLANTGILVPAQNPKEFARGLLTVLADENFRKVLGKRARARALKHFTLDKMLSNYNRVYNSLHSIDKHAKFDFKDIEPKEPPATAVGSKYKLDEVRI